MYIHVYSMVVDICSQWFSSRRPSGSPSHGFLDHCGSSTILNLTTDENVVNENKQMTSVVRKGQEEDHVVNATQERYKTVGYVWENLLKLGLNWEISFQ